VRQVFLAGSNDVGQVLSHGYAADGVDEQLMKLDVSALKPVKHISLSAHHCVPVSAIFLQLGDYRYHSIVTYALVLFV